MLKTAKVDGGYDRGKYIKKITIIIGLNLGKVDSNLSRPFQGSIPDKKFFTPEYSVQKLLQVLTTLTSEQSGKCFACDGTEVNP